jgi:hypothetical protein
MQKLTETQLRQLAHKRVEFKAHLTVYLVVNGALWIIWWFTGHFYPWPVWPLAGWGIGLIFHYLFDYRYSTLLSEEEEYKKLKGKFEEEEQYASK